MLMQWILGTIKCIAPDLFFFFLNPAGIYWHFTMAKGQILAVLEKDITIINEEDSMWSKQIR